MSADERRAGSTDPSWRSRRSCSVSTQHQTLLACACVCPRILAVLSVGHASAGREREECVGCGDGLWVSVETLHRKSRSLCTFVFICIGSSDFPSCSCCRHLMEVCCIMKISRRSCPCVWATCPKTTFSFIRCKVDSKFMCGTTLGVLWFELCFVATMACICFIKQSKWHITLTHHTHTIQKYKQ